MWRELLADLTTPVSAFLRLVGDEPGFLFESVEHERWGRWSFVGRRPAATIVARGGSNSRSTHRCPRTFRSTAACSPRSRRSSRTYRSPSLPELPPLHGGLVGYLGYDIVREVERLPDIPARRSRQPRRSAFDHRRAGGVRPLPAAGDARRERVRAAGRVAMPSSMSSTTDALARLDQIAEDGARPINEPLVEPPDRDEPLPEVRSSMGLRLYCDAVEAAREHILAGDIFQVVLAQRYDLDLDADPFDVYRVLRQVNPSPYMYFIRNPELTIVGSSPEPMVQLLDGRVDLAADRGDEASGPHRRRRPPSRRPSSPSIRRSAPSTSCSSTSPATTSAAWCEFGTEKVDEMMTLERYSPRDAPHVAGVGHAARRARADRRAAGDAAGRHRVGRAQGAGDGDHRLARAGQARPVRGRRRLHRLLGQPRHRHRHPHDGRRSPTAGRPSKPAPASWSTRSPSTRTSSAATRRRRCSPPSRCPSHDRARRAALSLARVREPFAAWIERDVVRASGPGRGGDSCRANSARTSMRSAIGASTWSLLLQPSGKVDAWLRVTRDADDEFVLDVDGGWGDKLIAAAGAVQAAHEVRPRPRRRLALPRRARHDRRRSGRTPRAADRVAGGRMATTCSVPTVEPPDGIELAARGRVRAPAHRSRRACPRARVDRCHHSRRGGTVAGGRVGQLHQGLLHRPGARRPHRLPRRQRASARSAACGSRAPRARGDEIVAGGKADRHAHECSHGRRRTTVALAPLSRTVARRHRGGSRRPARAPSSPCPWHEASLGDPGRDPHSA